MERLFRLTLDTNPEDCNLSCMMCEEHSEFSEFKNKLYKETGIMHRRMPEEWIGTIFNEAQKLGVKEIIPSTMGEPLLYKHIDTFFHLAAEKNILINLTTNGTFPGKTVKEWADLIIPVTIDTKFSVNGATATTAEPIMKGLKFTKQIENIREFVAYRNMHYQNTGFYSRITFQLTFMQNNMHELPGIIRMAADLDVDRIKGHHLWTHFEEIKALSFKHDKTSIEKWNAIVKKAYEAADYYVRPNGKKVLLEQIEYLNGDKIQTVPEEYDCPFLIKELWISATGKISPCCAPDESRAVLGNFGKFPESSLFDAINSPEYKNLITHYKNFDLCKTCVMRKPIKR
jgi:MoaA/NifB/PqqE/SkfB family radical SAM enzyme